MTKEPGGVPEQKQFVNMLSQLGCIGEYVNLKTNILPNFIFKGNAIEYGGV